MPINILDFQVANMIAAGEVVDRPASVVKELLENAIDAGATEIEVEIRRGGVSYIRVTDNGGGMSRDDAEICILRHATSKIKNAEDLERILTLGFRGEALAAISAVSDMTITTKRKEDKIGTEVICSAGRIVEVSDAGCRSGTTMVVRDLFYNVPARRKFLKRDQSEGMAATAVLEKIALSHPEIAFKMVSDGAVKLQTAGDKKLYNAIYALLGRDFASKLIAVKSKSEAVEVFGYIGRPDNARPNRNYQNFFINGRYVKSRTATAALEQAYASFMESEKFPCCVLNVVIHPSLVDVNIHPTKLEVKFSSEKTVFDAIYLACRNALLNDTTRPEMQLEKKNIDARAIETYNRFVPVYDRMDERPEQTKIAPTEPQTAPNDAGKAPAAPFDDLPFIFGDIAKTAEQTAEQTAHTGRSDIPAETGPKAPTLPPDAFSFVPQTDLTLGGTVKEEMPAAEGTSSNEASNPVAFPPETPKNDAPDKETEEDTPFKLLGIAFETYILAEVGNKLLMIDKHAAHERLLFEKMKKNMSSEKNRYVQLLLVPEEVYIGTAEKAAVIEYEEELQRAGFVFEEEDLKDAVRLLGIPGMLEKEQATTLFSQIVTSLASGEGDAEVSRQNAFEKCLYTASCKAAMKGSRHDDEAHLIYLVKELLRLPDIRYCPHGRPVAFEIPKGSIENKFKRS